MNIMNVWVRAVQEESKEKYKDPGIRMCLARSRNIKEASVSPVVTASNTVVEREFEGQQESTHVWVS
jgi:hypothetical protein